MASTESRRLNGVLQRAIDAFHAGQVRQAIDLLERQAADFPNAPRLWGYLGFLHGELGEHGKAAKAFRKAAKLSPHSERASLGLFHSLWRSGKVDAAFREMRRFAKGYDAPQYRELLRGMLSERGDGVFGTHDSLSVDEMAEVERDYALALAPDADLIEVAETTELLREFANA